MLCLHTYRRLKFSFWRSSNERSKSRFLFSFNGMPHGQRKKEGGFLFSHCIVPVKTRQLVIILLYLVYGFSPTIGYVSA